MRKINRVILHCSATEKGVDFKAKDIRSWHLKRGWSDIGYHYVINIDGKVEAGRPIHKQGAHTKGHNKDSIGVCYVGGVLYGKPHDTMTKEQELSFLQLLAGLIDRFGDLSLHGHNEFANKACPSFDVSEKFKRWI